MSMLSFKKNRHETLAPKQQVVATEGRDIPFRYPAEQDPSGMTRVAAASNEEGPDGTQYDVVELVMGETVTAKRGERRTIKTIAEDEMDTQREWAKHQFGRGAWTSLDAPVTYLVEYPREEAEDFIDGLVLSMDSTGLVRQYLIHEEDDQVVVESEEKLEEDFDFPKGTRVTCHVRGRMPTDGSSQLPEVNAMQRDEETLRKEEYVLGFMRSVREAIDAYGKTQLRTQAMGDAALHG